LVGPEGIERRLAAILSADAVGYSRLMADDEQATIRTITAYRKAIGDLVEEHRGRVVDSPGDNLLAEFPTDLDAVQAAIEIQKVLKVRNEALPEDRRMEFRIGVHLGDVSVQEGRLYGDGVNIAARLEGLAEPGGICISGTAYDVAHGRLDLGFEDLGEQEVKNIPDPVRVYRVLLDPGQVAQQRRRSGWSRLKLAAASTAAVLAVAAGVLWLSWPAPLGWVLDLYGLGELPSNPPLPERPSLVVLPFDDLSPKPGQEYFAGGLTEDLADRLISISNLFVISRNTAKEAKDRRGTIAEIGRALGVRYVLQGSAVKAGSRVNVTAQLIEAATDHQLWSESYDRDLADLFALQAEIAEEILRALSLETLDPELQRVRRVPTDDLSAYETYLKAIFLLRQDTRRANAAAIELFERATELDPDFADAHAALGSGFYSEYGFGWSADREVLERAEALSRKAISIDSRSASGHAVLAGCLLMRGEIAEARMSAERAIAIAPGHPLAQLHLSLVQLVDGSVLTALDTLQRAVRRDPEPFPGLLGLLGALNFRAGRVDKAIAMYERARASSTDFIAARLALIYLYETLGQRDKNGELVEEILQTSPGFSIDQAGFPAQLVDEPGAYLEALRRAGVPEEPRPIPADLAGRPGIAVLPFCNLSGDPEQAYFVDGITEDLTAVLSLSPDLLVISRSSSSRYACQPPDLKQVGRELGVRYILEGSVRRAQKRVRITAQLINATSDVHVWSESYERDLSPANVFDIQSDIAQQISNALQIRLREWEGQRETSDPTAWDLTVRARYLVSRVTSLESLLEVRAMLERAIELDPDYAPAHAGVAGTYYSQFLYGWAGDENPLARCASYARQALALDPHNASGHESLGVALHHQGKHAEAIREVRRAIELNPSSDFQYVTLAMSQIHLGQLEDAQHSLESMRQLNPRFTPVSYWAVSGRLHYLRGDLEQATAAWERVRSMSPLVGAVRIVLVYAYSSMGREGDARAIVEEIVSVRPEMTARSSREVLARLWKEAWIPRDLEEHLRKAGLP
jgi:adenylate cyclase